MGQSNGSCTGCINGVLEITIKKVREIPSSRCNDICIVLCSFLGHCNCLLDMKGMKMQDGDCEVCIGRSENCLSHQVKDTAG